MSYVSSVSWASGIVMGLAASILGSPVRLASSPASEFGSSADPSRDLAVCVVVQAETLTPLANVAVRVGGVRSDWSFTDATGVASAGVALGSQPFEVAIRSAEIEGGLLLEQSLSLTSGGVAWAAEAARPYLVAHCTLPVAWNVALPAMEPSYARPWHDRWIVWPSPDWTGPSTRVRIAHLGCAETLNGYLRSRTGDSVDAALGLALLADSSISLPESGLALSIDTLGSEVDSEPQVSLLQVVDEAWASSPTVTLAVQGRHGRYRDVLLRGTLQRGANLLIFSRRPLRDRVVSSRDLALRLDFASKPPSGLEADSDGAESSALHGTKASPTGEAPTAPPPSFLQPVAGWNLPESSAAELETALIASDACVVDVEEHQASFAVPGCVSDALSPTEPWAIRVLWIGTPAVHVESGSWSHWGPGAVSVETWSGALDPSAAEGDRADLTLWFYRRQKRRITTWTTVDAVGSDSAPSSLAERAVLSTPRRVRSVCVQTSGACGVFVQR